MSVYRITTEQFLDIHIDGNDTPFEIHPLDIIERVKFEENCKLGDEVTCSWHGETVPGVIVEILDNTMAVELLKPLDLQPQTEIVVVHKITSTLKHILDGVYPHVAV